MFAVIEVHWSVPRRDQKQILLSRGRAVQPGILVAGRPPGNLVTPQGESTDLNPQGPGWV